MPLYRLDEELPPEIADHGDDPIPLDTAADPGASEPEVAETNPSAADRLRQQAAAQHVPPEDPDDEIGDDDDG